MKKLLSLLACLAVPIMFCATSFAQYLIVDDDNPSGNTATVYKIAGNGTLTQFKVLPTGGTGFGGGFFANVGATVSQNASCVFIEDAGSNDIAAFSKATGFTKVGNFSNAALNWSGYFGGSMSLTPDGHFLYAGYSGSENVGAWKVNANCSLTFIAAYVPSNGPDTYGAVKVLPNGKGLLVTAIDLDSVTLFVINSSTGALTEKNTLSWTGVGNCDTNGCYPTGIDITKDSKVAIFGNATLGSPAALTANITLSGLTNPQVWDLSNSAGASNNNVPWLSPGAYSTGSGYLYFGMSGFQSSGLIPGVVTASFTESPVNITVVDSIAINNPTEFDGRIETVAKTPTGGGLVVAEWFTTLGTFKINTDGSLTSLHQTTDTQADGGLSFSVYPPSR